MIRMRVDLSEFTGRWEEFIAKTKSLPRELMNETASLTEHVMKEKVPVRRIHGGTLESTVHKTDHGTHFEVGPHVWYSKYPIYYGKKQRRYPHTYAERTKRTVDEKLQGVLEAKANEVFGGLS